MGEPVALNPDIEKVCKRCGRGFVAKGQGSHLRTKCYSCSPPRRRTKKDPRPLSERPMCQLDGCRKRVPITRRPDAKYCCHEHTVKAGEIRQKERKEAKRAAQSLFVNPDTETRVKQERQGEVYDRIKSDPYIEGKLLSGDITATAVGVMWGVSTAAVTRAMHAILSERAIQQQQAEWSRARHVQAMLPVESMKRLKELGMSGQADTDEFDELLTHVVRAYALFSRFFFRLEGKRPIIKEFHLNWIAAVIRAWAVGGKQLILSPPRHGKSEMLIRFVIWFIVMDPNIRIGWFCASRDVAELMLGAVKDHLENNEKLIRATLPPGQLYDPGLKSGRPWSKKEIKVRQQSHVGQKSSSLLALGLTSKFLSRDMDLIIIDDPEDFDSTNEESQRKKARNKLAEIGTRKEEHTAMCYISSRQHPDDIPNHLLALEGTRQSWNAIVDSAHSEECPLDPYEFDIHTTCMLFPEVRSYRWLMEKKEEMEVLGIPHAFSMRYLNRPVPEEGQVFDVRLIREVALNRERGLGLEDLPLGHLVAGLDPSARGIQAAFLWHYRETGNHDLPVKMSMVDLDAQKAGGVTGAIDIICDWYERYGLTLWFYETNSQQIEFYKLVKEGVAKRMDATFGFNPVTIKEHSTGQNKKDAELGISAMAPLYHSGAVDLPYGTNEARVKVNMLLRQLELWTADGVVSKKALTDIKLAQWFPFVGRIQSFIRQVRTPKLQESYDASYQGVDSYGNTAPWSTTAYPGG